MFDYIRYYLSPFTLIFAIVGLYLGGGYVWLGLATLPVLALVDSLVPKDYRIRNIKKMWLAYIPVILSSFFAFVIFCLLALRTGEGSLSAINQIGAILSTGWVGTIVGVPAFHELFHRANPLLRNLGLCLQVMYLDATRDIAHVIGHHIDVGTPKDSDTARRGESLYSFASKAMIHSFLTSLKKESDALEKRGKGRWSIGHRLWRAILGLVIFQSLMFVIGGFNGMLATFIATFIARFLLEGFNYFQHYGQVRVEGTPIEKRHVWNHFGRLSRCMTFEITNHADHHLNAYIPYYDLKPDPNAVQIPNVFLCFMAALIPPVWERFIIMPALKEWDIKHATPDEKFLANQQNKAVGWPVWIKDTKSFS